MTARTTTIRLALTTALVSVLALTGCGGGLGGGGKYPARKITLVVPYAPGGSGDPVGRQYAKQLEKALDVPVVVENREGGSGTIGTSHVVQAKADGYTIGLGLNGGLALQPLVNDELPYSDVDDYTPVVKIADLPLVLAVQADAPWRTMDELVAAARKNPGGIKISAGSKGGSRDLQMGELDRVAGTKLTTVPFSGGGGEAVNAVVAGRVDAVVVTAPGLSAQVKAGKLRVLGTFTKDTYDFFPEAQPVEDAGYDVRTFEDRLAIIAPKDLPADVRTTLVDTSREVVKSKEFTRFLSRNGYVGDPRGPKELADELRADRKLYESALDRAAKD